MNQKMSMFWSGVREEIPLLVMFFGGLITFGMRFSFIYLFGRVPIPERLRRALYYVPPAVLAAIIFPEILVYQGQLALTLGNERLLAGVVAVLIAGWTKNTLITILAGMTALLMLQLLRDAEILGIWTMGA
ncbi:MAG: AzlD domain-containing protein [Cyanobacteriota bacterium]|nr:AzlD domain-containing protein [Cyanobacteriota bacterium]